MKYVIVVLIVSLLAVVAPIETLEAEVPTVITETSVVNETPAASCNAATDTNLDLDDIFGPGHMIPMRSDTCDNCVNLCQSHGDSEPVCREYCEGIGDC